MGRYTQRHTLEPPVLVWSVGKVASSSIYATLKQNRIDAIHVHYLSDELVSHQINWMYADRALPLHMVASLRFLHAFRHELYKAPVRIITLVRDPLARNISAYFENLKNYGLTAADEPALHVENFLKRYHHGVVYDWFDDELLRVTGIDYRKLEFDPAKGWCIYRDAHFHLLVLRAEESDARKLEALTAFFDCEFSKLVRVNEGESKGYKEIYSAFKDTLTLPQDYVDRIYRHPFCKVFWTQDEISAMRANWRTSSAVEAAPPSPDSLRETQHAVGDVQSDWQVHLQGFDRHAALTVSGVLTCDARLAVRLYDRDSRLVTSFGPRAGTPPLRPGRFDLSLSVPDLPLTPGVYSATLEVLSQGPDLSTRVRLAPLVIERTSKRLPREGLLATSFQWEQRTLEERGPAR